MSSLYIISPQPTQYAVARDDAKLYNFKTQGWDTLDATTGIPTADNLKPMPAFATVGPLKNQRIAPIPDITNSGGALAFLVFVTNTDGSLAQTDCIPCVELAEIGIRGGRAS